MAKVLMMSRPRNPDDCLRLESHVEGDVVVLTVVGELDFEGSDAVVDAVAAALQARPRVIEARMAAAAFIGSAGLAAMIEATKPPGTLELTLPSWPRVSLFSGS